MHTSLNQIFLHDIYIPQSMRLNYFDKYWLGKLWWKSVEKFSCCGLNFFLFFFKVGMCGKYRCDLIFLVFFSYFFNENMSGKSIDFFMMDCFWRVIVFLFWFFFLGSIGYWFWFYFMFNSSNQLLLDLYLNTL